MSRNGTRRIGPAHSVLNGRIESHSTLALPGATTSSRPPAGFSSVGSVTPLIGFSHSVMPRT
jgi:hypothetical protein